MGYLCLTLTTPQPRAQQTQFLRYLALVCPYLPRRYSWVTDSDEVGWDAMAPPQLPGNAPVPANGQWRGECQGGLQVPLSMSLSQPPPTLRGPTHRILSIQECHVR